VSDSGHHHCLMTWPPALEATRRQMGKLYLPAVRSDKEEFGVTHLDILGAAAPGCLGWQKKDPRASTYAEQGYRRCVQRQAFCRTLVQNTASALKDSICLDS